MTAVAHPSAPTAGRMSAVELYRDDGPVARLLARAVAPLVPLPAVVLAVVAALPAVVVVAARGSDAGTGVAAAVVAWFVLLAGASGGRPQTGRLIWVVPPILRLVEYGLLTWLATVSGGGAAAAFALLAALAFRHYDAVYRLRHQAEAPAAWVRLAGGGWDGRLLLAWALLALGLLPGAFFVAAAVLGAVSVAESVTAWLRFTGRMQRPDLYVDEEDEDA